MRPAVPYSIADTDHSPLVVFYEITRACDLACQHCRACAQPRRHPNELKTDAAKSLIEQLAKFPKPPLLVITGGDPIKRDDCLELVRHGVEQANLRVAMVPSATPLLTDQAVAALKDAGLARLGVSIDGADPNTHDALRGIPGTYERAYEILRAARRIGLSTQVNTTITTANVYQVDAMAEQMAQLDIALWSVFFLVPVGRASKAWRISPEQYETVFAKLWHHARTQPYATKTTEAPFYRRFVLRKQGNPISPTRPDTPLDLPNQQQPRAPLGINDGKGILFISHTGHVYPSGFLPVMCGQYPKDSVVDLYQNHPVFRNLRNADMLKGKCRACDFRRVCGGSRARAYAVHRDYLAQEPDCCYQPPDYCQETTHTIKLTANS